MVGLCVNQTLGHGLIGLKVRVKFQLIEDDIDGDSAAYMSWMKKRSIKGLRITS